MNKEQQFIVRLAGEMKKRREGRGLTLAQVAKLASVSRSTIQRIEGGDDSVALSTVLAYASALDLGNVLAKSMIEAVRRTPARAEPSEGTRAGLDLLEKMRVG